MALYATNEKLTELAGYESSGAVRFSDKIIYFGELKAWKRKANTTYNYLDTEIVYTRAEADNCVGKFIYNSANEMYVVSDDSNEYYYYVKSYDKTSETIVVSYDTYENIKSGTLSNDLPLGNESISYERNADNDKNL